MPVTNELNMAEQEKHLLQVISSERFRKKEGLGNEVAHFIYDYAPSQALHVEGMKKRLKNVLATQHGMTVVEINLYELCMELLERRNLKDRVIAAEPEMDKEEFLGLLQNVLDPQTHLAPAIAQKLSGEEFDLVFLTGVGEVFPFIRSHTVLLSLIHI